MSEVTTYAVGALVVGAGATVVMDAWAVLRTRWLGVPPLDYALVGRWLGHLARGRFRHDRIAASPAVPGERVLGWVAHYLIGAAFAAVLLIGWGSGWLCRPAILPALAVGVGSVAAPFLILQPGMGAGIAASRTPNPPAARWHSLITHTVFGLGLYVTGLAAAWLGVWQRQGAC
jgi:hypothetical protein